MDAVSLRIAIASARDPKWGLTLALTRLFAHCAYYLPDKSKIDIDLIRVFDTAQARRKLVARAKSLGDTHILFIDDDNTFPPDAALRLLEHGKEIVAANYTTRGVPVTPLASLNGERVHSRGHYGLQKVDFAPTGFMLIDMRVFDKIERPYFDSPCVEGSDDGISDDVYFCRTAQAAGIDAWIDHELSQEVTHVGEYAFSHAMTQADEPDWRALARELAR